MNGKELLGHPAKDLLASAARQRHAASMILESTSGTTMSQEFYDAATFGDMDAVRQMLAANPSLVHSKIKWDFTALHGVAGEEQFEMAELLLDAGADPNARNDEGITPLHLAAYPEMVELLAQRGADINVRSNDGRTPLLLQAAEADGYEAMEALLKLGADAKITDNHGQSALDIARARELDEKLDLLRAYGVDATKRAISESGDLEAEAWEQFHARRRITGQ